MTRNPLLRHGRLLLAAGLLLAAAALPAQSFSFFRERTRERGTREEVPTVITSDTLDVDIAKDVAVFTGNVVVEDQEMRISCDKMIIHLVSATPPSGTNGAAAGAGTTTSRTEAAGGGDKRVSRIVCLGNVIIIRKAITAAEQERGEQKALAGKADYDVDSGQIVLTEDPVLTRGSDSLRGERITIWRDSDKMKVEGGSKLELKAESLRDRGAENESEKKTP